MSNEIKKTMQKIEIPKELDERVKLGVMKAKSEKPKRKINKIVIPLVVSIFLMFSTVVGAAYIPSFNNLLAIVSPKIALMLQPIDSDSVSKGIKMEVVAAMNDNETAVIYVTLQDLTGNRVDETLDLYDYFLSGFHIFNSQIVNFDKTTNTATLRIQVGGGKNIDNQKVNFKINSFLSDKQIFEDKININLSEISNSPSQTVTLDMNNIPGGSGILYRELKKQETVQVLKPNETNIELSQIGFMNISNIGKIDNRLHIQAHWIGNYIDTHGYFYFINDLGHEIHPSTINFGMDTKGNTVYGHDYTEYIFDLDSVNLDKQELLGYFVSNGEYTTGNWDTTFKIQSVNEEINSEFHKEFGTWDSDSVSISPLGVTIYGNGNLNNSTHANIDVGIKMKDGSIQTLNSVTSFSENEEVTVKFLSPLPLELSKVNAININGSEIEL